MSVHNPFTQPFPFFWCYPFQTVHFLSFWICMKKNNLFPKSLALPLPKSLTFKFTLFFSFSLSHSIYNPLRIIFYPQKSWLFTFSEKGMKRINISDKNHRKTFYPLFSLLYPCEVNKSEGKTERFILGNKERESEQFTRFHITLSSSLIFDWVIVLLSLSLTFILFPCNVQPSTNNNVHFLSLSGGKFK